MIGQRGVPATFGGIEHHVEELGARLVERGHEVTVFCRTNYVARGLGQHRGMFLRPLPTVSTKHLDAFAHSALASVIAVGGPYDVVHYHALGPGLFAPIPRYLSRAKVVQTVHGLDDERAKWGPRASRLLRAGRWLSTRVPDATIVVSQALREHYLRVDGRCPEYVPNGVVPPTPRRRQQIDTQLPLHGRPFALFVGRLVPEKAPHTLVRAFAEIPGDMALVVAGGTSFSDEYVRSLRALAAADDRVILAGYVYGALLQELYTNAELFVLPSVLEGLPLTLLEAASYGTPAVASAIPAHLEVLGQGAPGRRLFPPGDEAALAAELKAAFAGGEAERRGARALQAHVLETYRWDDVAAATDRIYASVLAG